MEGDGLATQALLHVRGNADGMCKCQKRPVQLGKETY